MSIQADPVARPEVVHGRHAPPAGRPPRTGDWAHAVALPGFMGLIAVKRRMIAPLLLLPLTYFLGTMLLAGYSRPLMGTKVVGSLNLGYVLIIITYLMCWVVALLYARIADSRFDPQAAQAISEFERGGVRS